MTDARKAAKAAAQEVIEQTEINIRDLRKSLRERAWQAAYDYASDTPNQYRDDWLKNMCSGIASEVVEELLGGKE